MKFILDTTQKYIQNDKKLLVDFPFFLPEVDLKEELNFATRIKVK